MNANVELETWRALWRTQSDGPAASDLRDRVARETRRRHLGLVLPVAVTAVIGSWVISRAVASAAFDDVVVAIETWLFVAVMWFGALWIDRGNWRPLVNTMTGFVELSIRRRRSTLAGLRFAAAMYIAQLAFLVFWKLLSSPSMQDVLTAWPVVVLGWIGTPAFLAFASWYGRRVRAELGRLEDLRTSLAD
jgi:hypothetical protein